MIGGWLLVLTAAAGGAAGSASTEPAAAVAHAPMAAMARSSCFACYWHVLARSSVGAGLRLNNPFRLQTSLGEDERSVSATAAYYDQLLGVLVGDSERWQHGVALSWSTTLAGVPQDVLIPSYVAYRRLTAAWSVHGRLGVPIILHPDANAGGEVALGATWLLRGGIGVFADAVGSLFVGAATYDRSATTVPVLSLQAGLSLEYEVLP